jgi:ABC-type Mn2+/Zn2+ transport system permease subunit
MGLAISYGPDLPAGATTILLAGVVYVAVKAAGGPVERLLAGVRGNRHHPR